MAAQIDADRGALGREVELFVEGHGDFVQPDVTNAGGIAELAFITTLAATSYVCFAPHNPSGSLSTAATLQLAATLPNFWYLESDS
ncbi:enolase C-terminal domain-like protein [Micromonospora sp. NPDC005324]|uniref:enolase C-terminal domain-like protein n=1 Tax=Micromonospora sp. NPDC005324 TaxID=3157033 RepID=UPI0033BEEEB1